MLIKRRDTIARTYLTAINPIVDPRLDAIGGLTFGNAAFDAGVATGAPTYHAAWMRFDNATGETTPLAELQGTTTAVDAPRNLPTAPGTFIAVDVSADIASYPRGGGRSAPGSGRAARAGRSSASNGYPKRCHPSVRRAERRGDSSGIDSRSCGVAAAAIVRAPRANLHDRRQSKPRHYGIKPVQRRRRRLGEGPADVSPDYDAYWKQTKMTASAHAEWPSTHSSGT